MIHALQRKLWSASGVYTWASVFLMYINYLKACSLSSYVRMYADDTYLTPCAIDPEMLKFELNHYLEIVHSWLYANKLSLKTKKTKIPYK